MAVSAQGEPSRGLGATSARGALWITLASGAAVVLGYYRSWILGRLGPDGEFVGEFAILLLFVQILITFFSFGGATTLTTLLPRLPTREERGALLANFGLLTTLGLAVFVTMALAWRAALEWSLQRALSEPELWMLLTLAPFALLGKLLESVLSGMLRFGAAALASVAQALVVCSGLTLFALVESGPLRAQPIVALGALVLGANALISLVAGRAVYRDCSPLRPTREFPRGFWPLAWNTQGNKLTTFGFLYVDQLLVLHFLGVSELGVYFVMCQLAMLVRYVPIRIGQVMLASFSLLSGRGEIDRLIAGYRRLCRFLVLIGTPLALALALNSNLLVGIFGDYFASRHLWLLPLVLAMQLGLLESASGMLSLAQEKSGRLLAANVAGALLQVIVMLLLAPKWGVWGVIAGRVIGLAGTQAGLFLILLSALPARRLPPPWEYFAGLALTGATLAGLAALGPLPTWLGALLTIPAVLLVPLALRVSVDEVADYARLLRGAIVRPR